MLIPFVLAAASLLADATPWRVRLVAGPDAPPDAALAWRAWSAGGVTEASATSPAEAVGGVAPRVLVFAPPNDAAGEPWRVVVEGESGGDTWFAVTTEPGAACLVPVPVPSPSRQARGVRLAWESPLGPGCALRGLSRWQVLRSREGDDAEIVGEVGAAVTTFTDDGTIGRDAAWALRPVFFDGMTGRAGRFSDPAE